MIRKRRSGRGAAWLLVLAMIAGTLGVAGCGRAEGAPSENDRTETPLTVNDGDKSAGETNQEKVMGRYLEQMDDSLKEELNVESKLVQMDDGSLVLLSKRSGKWVSRDNGATWEKEELAWYAELNASNWLLDIAVAKDGYTAVIYEAKDAAEGGDDSTAGEENGEDPTAGEENEDDPAAGEAEGDGADSGEDPAAGEAEGDDADSGEDPAAGEEEGIDMTTMDFSTHPRYRLIAPDGSFQEIEIPYQNEEYVNRFVFSDDGRLFGSALGGKVYEIDRESGSCKEWIELPQWVQYMVAKDDKLMMADGRGVTILDLSSGELVEDPVLDDFMKEQGDSLEYHTTGINPLLILPGEEGILYLVFEKGIYRHVIGGNLIEQVVDGALTSLGNPSYGLAGGVLLENDVFLILFSSGEIAKYTYDPNLAAVPEVQLRAYSLMENEQLRTVISSYQAGHPEVYIRYETGMDKNLSATRDDALKKLNTEIAAGKGPDIFILDDMPMDSYVEKGVLADLTPYLEGMGEDRYFTNIIRSFWTPEGIYGVPAQFQIALLAGKQEDIEKMTDLEAIAEMAEAYREKKPDGMIFGARGEEEMLNALLPVCAPAWKTEDGKIDGEALTEFYTLAKRIWAAENEGLREEAREEYEEWMEDMRASGITEEEIQEYQRSMGGKMLNYLVGDQEFVPGVISDSFGFDEMISCFKIKGKTDGGFVPYSGQAKGVFVPDSIMGISRTSAHQDIAVELLMEMLEDDGWRGIPVNREKCRERFLTNATEDGGSYGSMGVANLDGSNYIGLDIYPASEEEIGLLMKIAEEGNTPYVRDSVLEGAVCEAGKKVLRGEMDIAAAVEEVMEKTEIYMSE